MFDFPLPVPSNTSYELLGLSPEATTEEVREATLNLVTQLKAEKQSVDAQLEEVRTAVAGLREASEQVKRLQEAGQESDPAEIVRADRLLSQLEQQAVAVNPRYRELCDRSRELAERILQVNCMALQNPDERQSYDRANPPLELLKLADCACEELADSRVVLALLRQELTEFLTARGEEVFHPSDLTRRDFRDDYSYQPLLDGPDS